MKVNVLKNNIVRGKKFFVNVISIPTRPSKPPVIPDVDYLILGTGRLNINKLK